MSGDTPGAGDDAGEGENSAERADGTDVQAGSGRGAKLGAENGMPETDRTDTVDRRLVDIPDEPSTLGAEKRRETAQRLLDAADDAGEAADIETEDKCLDELQRLSTAVANIKLARAHAKALANATNVVERPDAYWEACPDDRPVALLDRLAELHEHHDDEAITLAYARGLANIVNFEGRREAFENAATYVSRLETLYDGESSELAAYLAEGLRQEARRHARSWEGDGPGDVEMCYMATEEIRALYEDHSTDAVAAQLAGAYSLASVADGMSDQYESQAERVARLSTLYEKHPTDEVAGQYVWAFAIAAGDAGRRDDTETVTEYIQRAKECYDDHQVERVAESMARVYQNQVDIRFETQREHITGEEALAELESLYEEYPDTLATEFSLKLALAVRVYVEDGCPGHAERKLDRLERLWEAHPDATEDNLRDAVEELVEYYIDTINIQRARELFDHPVTPDPRDRMEATTLTPNEILDGALLLSTIYDDDDDEFAVEERRPLAGVSVVESPLVGLFLTLGVLGLYALYDPSLWLVTNWYPRGESWGLVKWVGVVITVPLLLYIVYTTGAKSPPDSLYTEIGSTGVVLAPALLEDSDGSQTATKVDAVILLSVLVLVALAVLDPVLMALGVYGLAVWAVMNYVVAGIALLCLQFEWLSPSVSTRVSTELLDQLDRTPAEAEHLTHRIVRDL
jgi:hypothetical protein